MGSAGWAESGGGDDGAERASAAKAVWVETKARAARAA